MEFGIQIEPQFGFDYDSVVSISEKAIENGFSTLWFSDHFMLDKDATDKILLDPWLLMTGLVRDNFTIRVGSLVFCNSYRPPPLHAKMGATLDVLSSGRFEFGIGAGWKEIEYNAYGYDFPKALTRISQLSEALQIIKGIWTEERFSFHGEHYVVEDLISFPKPFQKPHPKIWIGSMEGKEKMLRVAAQYGDGFNIAWMYPPKACEDIFSKLDGYCKDYSRKPSDISRSVGLWTRYFETDQDMESAIKEGAVKRGVSEDEYRARVTSALWGTSDMMIERLREYATIGVSHVILMMPHQDEINHIEKIGKKVIPKIY
jgi:alkanesulfonate monooxygenase SsuD/methylene tetrahydromethanopterin reductase-like flavin-dependent oxidoreductase (luciferase family)